MGFILLIVFILTIFRAWKQNPLYGRFANRPYDRTKKNQTKPLMFFVYLNLYFRTTTKHTCRG